MLNKKSRWVWLTIILIVLVLVGVLAKKMGWLGDKNTLEVSVEKVEKRDIVETVSASGKVQPEVELKITADVSGEITELYVKEGDVVKKGTLLCRINPEVYLSSQDRAQAAVNTAKANYLSSKSRLTQAESQFQQSEQNYLRNKKLFEDKVISPAEFDGIRSAFEVAGAEVEAARQSISAASFSVKSAEASLKESSENLYRTSIYAPVDGTVSKLNKEKGERVVGTNMMEGTEIMRLANLNEMEVSVDVSESDIVRVGEGDTADIEIDAWLGKSFKGIVTEVANSSSLSSAVAVTDQVTNYTVKIRILRESYSFLLEGKSANYSPFRPGMSATVDIRTRKTTDVITVPIQSVTTRDTLVTGSSGDKKAKQSASGEATATAGDSMSEIVFVYADGKATLRVVKTGIQDNQYIEITEGLKAGEEVITGPYSAVSKTIKNGSVVKVVPKEQLFIVDDK